MRTSHIIPAYDPLQAPFIQVKATVIMPGITNGKPNIERRTKYCVAPSAKKIATYIVNQIFGSELVTQTEGLSIGWLMPTLKEALEEGIYQGESFIYIHKFDNKVYLECIRRNEIHNLVQKFDKVQSCTIKQEYKGIYADDETIYQLNRDIKIENGITYMEMTPYAVDKKGEKEKISLALFNERTGSDYIEKYILPYEVLINIDLGQNFFEDSEKLLNEEMMIINTIAEEIEKTKTRIVTTQHYQSGDIVGNWQPRSSHYDIQSLNVGQLQDYFTLLPGDKEHQLFEFLQGDIRVEQYVNAYKFYDYQIIQMAGLSPASFGYEKDSYMNKDNVDLSKNASEMTIEAIKSQIEGQVNKLIENIIKLQQSEKIEVNSIPAEMSWDYGLNEKFDDVKKLTILRKIENTSFVPYEYKARIVLPILEKLIDGDIDDNKIENLIEKRQREDNININYGEI